MGGFTWVALLLSTTGGALEIQELGYESSTSLSAVTNPITQRSLKPSSRQQPVCAEWEDLRGLAPLLNWRRSSRNPGGGIWKPEYCLQPNHSKTTRNEDVTIKSCGKCVVANIDVREESSIR